MKKHLPGYWLRHGIAVVLLAAGVAVSSVRAAVVINEAMSSNSLTLADEDGAWSDWIELKNTSAGAVDLSGWYLTDDPAFKNKWAFPAGTTLPGNGYRLVFASSKNRSGGGALAPHTNFNLGAGGEYLALTAADGVTVLHAFSPQIPALPADVSWGISSGGGPAYFTTPTPGAGNGLGVASLHPFINELHTDPVDSKAKFVEFIELHNPLPVDVDVSGWRFVNGVSYTFPANTTIAAGGYVVVAENPAHLQLHVGLAGALGPWTGGLSNEGEQLTLVDPAGGMMDRVEYGLGTPWPVVGDEVAGSPTGHSIQVINAFLDRSLGASWRAAKPTPGAANVVVAAVNPPPAIRQVTHFSTAPSSVPTAAIPSAQPVVITAKVTDWDGVASVVLEYQVVAPGSYIRTTDAVWQTAWTQAPMNDQGLHGDTAAGDDTYSVILPAGVQQHRRLIRYRIHAEDRSGSAVKVPMADDLSRNFAYFCYDGVPAWNAALQPGVTTPQVFPEAVMRKVRPWHLLSNATDVQNCQYNAAFDDGTYRFEGTIVVGDQVYDHVLYRAKGQNSTFNTGKNKWKFRFNRGRLLEMPDDYGQATTALDTLNLSSLAAPWAPWNRGLAGLDEAVAFRLANLADSPAPLTTYLQWRVIDSAEENPANQFNGDLWGLYLGFENQDNRFKDSHGLPDGNIFRLQATGDGNSVLGQGSGQPGDLTDLNSFVSSTTGYRKGGGTSTTPPLVSNIQSEDWFRANVHLPRYYNWRAVTEAINQTDRREQENVVYFRNPGPLDRRWEIYAWDVDLLYERLDRWGPQATQNASNLNQYEQISRLMLHRPLRIEFQNRARELQDLLLNNDQAWKVIDEFVSLISGDSPRIIPLNGTITPGFVEADRRRWDYNPANPTPPRGTGPTGNYYKTPYPIGDMGNGPAQPFSRVLATPDFAGMVRWVKEFIATGDYGGARLGKMALGTVHPYTLGGGGTPAALPVTPVITYSGPAGFPANQLSFTSGNYVSPAAQSFAAMEWRIGEILDPGVPGFVEGRPWKYEITPVWTSGILPSFAPTVAPPATGLAAGHTYRARVRHKDAAGYWSHWSAPLTFQAGLPQTGNLATDLVISSIMYHPPDPDGQDVEFIELMNIGTAPLDLTGVQFTAGILWSFPDATLLAPGARLLVVRGRAAFEAKYGTGLPVAGEYVGSASNSLSNQGETLTLSLGASTVLRSLTYGDSDPWPGAADGAGSALMLTSPRTNPDHAVPQSWTAAAPHPGVGPYTAWKTAHGIATDADDSDGDGLNAVMEYATGSQPGSPSRERLPIYAWQTDGSVVVTQACLANAGVSVFLQTSQDLIVWLDASASPLSITRQGELDVIQYRLEAGPPAPRFLRLRFALAD